MNKHNRKSLSKERQNAQPIHFEQRAISETWTEEAKGQVGQGTLGRDLIEGKKELKILGYEISVAAKIQTLGGLSAHADQSQLLQWVESLKGPKPEICLVHGEPTASLSLQTNLQRFGWEANIPVFKHSIKI